MGYRKEQFTSFEFAATDGKRLFTADGNFDFPAVYDANGNPIENLLMIKGRRLPEIDSTTEIDVYATKKNGDRLRFRTFVSVSTDRQLNVVLDPAGAKTMEERRRFFKIKTDVRAFITLRSKDDPETLVSLEPPDEIRIKDINIGGVFFVCTNSLSRYTRGDRVMIIVRLEGVRMELNAEVLREQPIDSPQGETGYGCRFVSIKSSEEEAISRYIYKLQYELIQKARELAD